MCEKKETSKLRKENKTKNYKISMINEEKQDLKRKIKKGKLVRCKWIKS